MYTNSQRPRTAMILRRENNRNVIVASTLDHFIKRNFQVAAGIKTIISKQGRIKHFNKIKVIDNNIETKQSR